MIDIKLVRENPKLVKDNIKKKFQDEKVKLVDEVLKLDKSWRELKYKEDALRADRNKISKSISELKKQKKSAAKEIKLAKEIPGKIEKIQIKRKKFEVEIKKILCKIPNIIDKSVPSGKDETKNKVLKKFGVTEKRKVKNHAEIGEELGVMNFDNSADTSGSGFYFLKGDLALLNMALINYARDFITKKGFTYVEPPLMIRKDVLDGVMTFEEIEQMAYKIEGEDLYLIATSEHPLIGQFINKTIRSKDLPILETAYSMCFRKEIGSHGIDEKGIFRTHQFNKQEMVVICEPSESQNWFKKMFDYSVELFKSLEIPFRVLEICSGDLGDLKSKQYDLEAYSPRKNDYFEITSLSNLTDAQARRLGIRVQGKKERYFAHTLNNTVIATSRAMIAIIENNQQKDGSIKIPKVLVPYMDGKKEIKAKKK